MVMTGAESAFGMLHTVAACPQAAEADSASAKADVVFAKLLIIFSLWEISCTECAEHEVFGVGHPATTKSLNHNYIRKNT